MDNNMEKMYRLWSIHVEVCEQMGIVPLRFFMFLDLWEHLRADVQ